VIAIITDTHFGQKAFSKNIFQTQLAFFEQEFFPYILKHDIKEVFCLGDIVHNRNTIDLWILQEMKRRFFKWFDDNNVNLHCLIGNHDSYFRSTIETNFLSENVTEFNNVIVYNTPKVIQIGKYLIHMVPWLVNEHEFKPEKADICCGHFDIIGMPLMKNMYATEGLEHSVFENYKYVFSGHFHIKSQKENVIYVGTQYQLTWNDHSEEKGFYVLNDNFKLKFIENKLTPKFVKIWFNETVEDGVKLKVSGLTNKIQDITGKEAVKIAKNNYVKLITDKVLNQSELDNIYTSMLLLSCNNYKIEIINGNEIIESFNFEEIESAIEDETGLFGTISTFIESINYEESVDKDKLLQIIKELYKESLDIVNDL
jgi:DNA repair exonuclease SbcCD nuclease subunit